MKKTALILVFLAFALAGASHPLPARPECEQSDRESSKQGQAQALLLKGNDHFARRELDRAEAELKACLEIIPENADALFLLAQVDYLKGDFSRALAGIQKAEEVHAACAGADRFDSPQHRKALLEARRQREEEIALLGETLNSDLCKTDHVKQRLPETIQQLRDEISAINAGLEDPPQTRPGPLPADYSFVHGNILFKLNEFNRAAEQYRKAIEADSGHLGAYNNLVNLCYVTKKPEDALKLMEQAKAKGVALNPKLKEAVLQLAKK